MLVVQERYSIIPPPKQKAEVCRPPQFQACHLCSVAIMFLLAIALACGPLCSQADSQTYKQMESRRLVPMKEDVLFHQKHTEIRPMSMGLHPISQMTKYLYLLSSSRHPTVTQPWMVNRADSTEVSCSVHKHPCIFYKAIHMA